MNDKGVVWVHIKFTLVDSEHKKPNQARSIIFSHVVPLDELVVELRKIEKLVNDGFIIEEMRVLRG